MENLFAGKVYEILPLSNGILFSYKKDELEIGDYVEYKMISFDNRRISNVAKNIYLLTKFGTDAKEIKNLCENYITVKTLILPGGKVFLLEPNGKAMLADSDATVIWTGDLTYKTFKPADITLQGNALWAVYPERNVLLKYNLSNMRVELRIGGEKTPFGCPVSIFAKDDDVIISNKDSKKLIKINLNDYNLEELESFDEPLMQYIEVQGHRFVNLESGLYIL
ncbi:MAG: hypothetical protein IKY45_04550 [Clostridia bacterium]|nr:hypothetical protein [Clostridia bacterium]